MARFLILLLIPFVVLAQEVIEQAADTNDPADIANQVPGDAPQEAQLVVETARQEIAATENNKQKADECDWLPFFCNWDDTGAQWLMAFMAISGVVLTSVMVYLLNRTLKATEDMVKVTGDANAAAQDAARAALTANEIQREMGETQLRAYIHISKVKAFTDIHGKNLGLTVVCKNIGQTPLRSAVMYVLVRHDGQPYSWCQTSFPEIPSGEEKNNGRTTYGELVLPDEVFETISHPEAGTTHTTNIGISIAIRGKDVFDKPVLASASTVAVLHYTDSPVRDFLIGGNISNLGDDAGKRTIAFVEEKHQNGQHSSQIHRRNSPAQS